MSVTVRAPAKADLPLGMRPKRGSGPRFPLRIDRQSPVLRDMADGSADAAALPRSCRRTMHTAQAPAPGVTVPTDTAHRGGPSIREGAA
ncbi:hypothetical protein TN53_42300 [Streptomyces sp. WM6386]|nr:hypothetical protein TN53_42300 [Streptomyces sp. WM6386]